MSDQQKRNFKMAIKALRPKRFRHGACRGGDREAHDIVRALFPDCIIAVHPSNIPEMWDEFCTEDADECFPAKPPLERNQDIVDLSHYIVAAPKTDEEQLRSGTWSTIRKTWKAEKPLIKLKR